MLRATFVLLTLASAYRAGSARHVYPFQYQGAMPSMVRMIDDPRQVGTDDEIISPPRYGARNELLKTHDFYPQDDAAILQNRGVGGIVLPPPPPAATLEQPLQPPTVPLFTQDPQIVYPQLSLQGGVQCFGIGAIRNEAMDRWCMENCNHLPSYCPPSHCACGGYKKKKK